jgi:hypothetical protein
MAAHSGTLRSVAAKPEPLYRIIWDDGFTPSRRHVGGSGTWSEILAAIKRAHAAPYAAFRPVAVERVSRP